MKYIIVERMGIETPIIFCNFIEHAEIVGEIFDPISAGFVRFNPVVCFGKSTTLKLESREEDADIIRNFLEKTRK